MSNRLAAETSPYLQQHANNPVDWYPWCPEALELARRENKAILLSIGYSACHWCHVMAHESFEDPAVAAVMNQRFVNIKVDREERPDLDQIYQSAHQMLTGKPGGWPLTMFLTPDGAPFFGGTYFPKQARYGLPGFVDLLLRLAEAFRDRRDEIEVQNASLQQALASTMPTAPERGQELDAAPIDAARELLAKSFDAVHGGFGAAPKFPHTTDLGFLLHRYYRAHDDEARDMALASLRHMAAGGLCDQLGGGFFRYSVDGQWQIPHFEKMLYDNALLLSLSADCWTASGDPVFRDTAEGIATWVLREMQDPKTGGYYSSLDADSEGHEGKFYVWSREEFKSLLTDEEYAVAAPYYGLAGAPNFEGTRWHLRVAASVAEDHGLLLRSASAKLFAARARRVRPGRDEKILTSWNALMIAAMARAGRVFERGDWLDSAQRALDFIRSTLWRSEPDGTKHRLLATYKDGRAHLNAYLDDHAFLIAALLELIQSEFRSQDLELAQALADALLDDFADHVQGGFFFTRHDHEALFHRAKPWYDNAMPSGNGVAAFALQRLALLTGNTAYDEAAARTLAVFGEQLEHAPEGSATLLAALEEALEPPRLIVLRGPSVEVRDWQRQLAHRYLPDTLILPLGNDLTGLPDALDKPATATVNAWVCQGVSCLPSVASWPELLRLLGQSTERLTLPAH